MLFNSFKYIFFLGIVVTAYYCLPPKYRLFLLFLASCVFYLAYKPEYIFILFFLISIDFVTAFFIAKAKGRRRILLLLISLGMNLGILFFFKYVPFLATLFQLNNDSNNSWFLLPLGLSFHTFQGMSYAIEVFKRKQKPIKNIGMYALYIMFFPQLAAGPIERPQQLLPQFLKKHDFVHSNIVIGLRLILWGMVKKIVIADRLGVIVNLVYAKPHEYNTGIILLATILFAFEIYCDFSGYSDIAIGSARLLGYKLVTNFSFPYLARSIADFWTRWHISLYTWFRDYIYIPLGGNRKGTIRRLCNILIVFALSGLWHGAGLHYIVWGLLNGLLICLTSGKFFPKKEAQPNKKLSILSRGVQALVTFLLIDITWIFFRAQSTNEALAILSKIFHGLQNFPEYIPQIYSLSSTKIFAMLLFNEFTQQIIIAIILVVALLISEMYLASHLSFSRLAIGIRWAVYFLLLFSMLVLGDVSKQKFIYFSF